MNVRPENISNDFVEDLSYFLTNYIDRYQDKISIRFGDEPIFTSEIFRRGWFLPMFLFDKQAVIDKTLQEYNTLHKTGYRATLHGFHDNLVGALGFEIRLAHNFINLDSNKEAIYSVMLEVLAQEILSQKEFVLNERKEILLDDLHFKLTEFFINKKTIGQTNTPATIDNNNMGGMNGK